MGAAQTVIHIDGGSRGNPGLGAFAYSIARPGRPALEEAGVLRGVTNNVAEYTALVRALRKAAELGLDDFLINSDSELLVKQMSGEYRVKHEDLKPLYAEASRLREGFSRVTIRHVRREHNRRADELCNLAMDGSPTLPLEVPDAPPEPVAVVESAAPARPRAKLPDDSAVRGRALTLLTHAGVANPAALWADLWFVLADEKVLKGTRASKRSDEE